MVQHQAGNRFACMTAITGGGWRGPLLSVIWSTWTHER